jgi:hypothetical protein
VAGTASSTRTAANQLLSRKRTADWRWHFMCLISPPETINMDLRLKWLALGTALALALGGGYSRAQNPSLKTMMRDKLAHAEPLLEAIVTTNYVAIERSTQALSRISEIEMLSWEAGAQPAYRTQAKAFVLAVQGLRDAARTRDIDAALGRYAELVSSCTRCHTHVGKSRLVRLESPPLPQGAS